MYENSEIWVDINGSRTQNSIKPERGLKQGCVLSPILFSLYMNDLGKILQETQLGIDIGDTNISCLMFADDICLIGRDNKSLLTLIDKTQDYAGKHGLEINPDKSEILCLHEEEGNSIWPLKDHDGVLIADLKQVLKYKYLGVPLSFQHKNIFKYRVSNVLIRANQFVGRIKSMSKESFNRLEVAEALWENVAIPALMYGMECMHLTKTELDKLESIQRNLAKWILGHDRNAAGVAAITELGWKSMHHRYEMKKVLMYGRLKYDKEIGDSRWIRKAFIEAQTQKSNIWWGDILELIKKVKLDDEVKKVPIKKQSQSKQLMDSRGTKSIIIT